MATSLPIKVRITECPRDAMQGIEGFIPTSTKIEYLNQLLKVGFGRLDFGSFVSPKAIPQMKDTAEVLESLEQESETELIAIVANLRGATDASAFSRINYLGYPFSISETFQRRNTNAGIKESFDLIMSISDIAHKNSKEVIIYLSMGFGNPYGDPYHPEMVLEHLSNLYDSGFRHFAIADTVGLASPSLIREVMGAVNEAFEDCDLGIHLHCRFDNWKEKVEASFEAGCLNFDTAMGGFGGCPMAGDKLVGNLSTENLIQYFNSKGVPVSLDLSQLTTAQKMSIPIFNS
ncbi:MAG: hydroxymethylglutaryl-CoA lyase [Bacteroidota bacterium]|jgi:hydroxymethylglutaryl-CoA lyase